MALLLPWPGSAVLLLVGGFGGIFFEGMGWDGGWGVVKKPPLPQVSDEIGHYQFSLSTVITGASAGF